MTHEEYVEELVRHINEMLDEYEKYSGYSLEFVSTAELSRGRTLTLKVTGERQ